MPLSVSHPPPSLSITLPHNYHKSLDRRPSSGGVDDSTSQPLSLPKTTTPVANVEMAEVAAADSLRETSASTLRKVTNNEEEDQGKK
jgi:hypothetical protein